MCNNLFLHHCFVCNCNRRPVVVGPREESFQTNGWPNPARIQSSRGRTLSRGHWLIASMPSRGRIQSGVNWWYSSLVKNLADLNEMPCYNKCNLHCKNKKTTMHIIFVYFLSASWVMWRLPADDPWLWEWGLSHVTTASLRPLALGTLSSPLTYAKYSTSWPVSKSSFKCLEKSSLLSWSIVNKEGECQGCVLQ